MVCNTPVRTDAPVDKTIGHITSLKKYVPARRSVIFWVDNVDFATRECRYGRAQCGFWSENHQNLGQGLPAKKYVPARRRVIFGSIIGTL